MSRYDTVVIGAGLAGLTTACLLARAGQKVLLVAGGAGAVLLASGCIDVLGYQPVGSPEPVQNPLEKLDDFLAQNPDHPYHHTGKDNLQAGLAAFLELAGQSSLDYRGTAAKNWLLPTPIGAVHPTCLAPASLANGDLSRGGRMLVAGFKELRDFYPGLAAENINRQKLGVRATAVTLNAPPPVAGKMNVTPLELAHAFEQPAFRRQVAQAIKQHSRGYSRVGLPAVLGLDRHAEVLADLQKQLGKTVFEITTLPPSVPGRRLFDALRRNLVQAGGRMILGSTVADASLNNGRVTHIRIETVNRLKPIQADNVVLATGGLFGGGIQTGADGRVWEPIFDLPVTADSNRHRWFRRTFLPATGQPVAGYGLKVNRRLNPLNPNGSPVAENLYAVGAVIAGSVWTRGRTGNGIAIATAAAVATQLTGRQPAADL